MYTLSRCVPWREALLLEGPALLGAMGIAEVFYKFHSFTLECGAFLATWWLFSGLLHLGAKRPQRTNV